MSKLYFPLFFILTATACSQAPAPAVTREPSAPTAAARQAGPGEYQVKAGDTLYRIAREHGMTPAELAELNGIDNPALLPVGQILRLRQAAAANAGGGGAAEVKATPIGSAGGVETRALEGGASAVTKPAGGVLQEPRGGKVPYSEEAQARLNGTPAAAPAPANTSPPAVTEAPTATTVPAGAAQAAGAGLIWPSEAKISAPYNGSSNKGIDFAGKQGDAVQAAGEGKVLFAGNGPPGYGKLVIVKHSTDLLSVYAHNSKLLVKEGQSVTQGQKIAEMGNSGTDRVKLHFEIRRQGMPVDPLPFLPKR
ncbi:peptidoglycan DD-metalloendopeptidase family protein [Azonexus sp.]|uniref:peptidoglycan DD-metalloendopeptidase family protein n=1 Tax=Azonexus sp. TaxID=1872668 RepID=UPI0039E2F1CE